MTSRLALRPDLNECALEDRTLMAYSPIVAPLILTTNGYIVLGTPPGLSSALNTVSTSPGGSGSANGGQGGNMATSFNISGFGPSSLTIGNVTGFPALNPNSGGGGNVLAFNFGGAVGSGANGPGSTGGGSVVSVAGYGSTFSSGYSFGLSSTNAYGMTTATIGSVPVHSYSNGASDPQAQAPDGQDNSARGSVSNQGNPTPDFPGGIFTLPTTTFGEQLLRKKPLGSNLLPGGPKRIMP